MQPSEKVVKTVAAREDTSHTEIEPLSTAIEPDALDRLFEPAQCSPDQQAGMVRFSYMGYRVTVTSDGQVSVE